MIDCFLILNNEEELVQYCLESYVSFADLIGVLSIVDNNSTDATLDIVDSFKDKLPIKVQHHRTNSHHGEMRTKAISICKSPWIFYTDGDESITDDMRGFLTESYYDDKWDEVRFYKYTTILDRFHYVPGGNGYTQRLFRNVPGVHFPQSIHTEPTAQLPRKYDVPVARLVMFDHTACKSPEALWAKGWRYNWAAREHVAGISDEKEYVWRVGEAYANHQIAEFDEDVKSRIFTGPSASNYSYPRIAR